MSPEHSEKSVGQLRLAYISKSLMKIEGLEMY